MARVEFEQRRLLAGAFIDGQGAARVKTASIRWINWAGNIPTQDDAVAKAFFFGVRHRDGR